ncbi:BTB/POZ domain-containing protein 6-like isoform X1 [Haliotis cracherodii]|uniref:BTB/POZ domain-containing protein 6-like isoform X1 n=1 Tax=Haliotis cracherodii TaxID=6455 RepID=UPI0039EA02D5
MASGYLSKWKTCNTLAQCNMHMLTSAESCDVVFRVGKEEKVVTAHRYVLISRSCVFNAMFCGPLAEKDDISIPDVGIEDFEAFLRYLYTDIPDLTPDNATTMLYLAKKYAVGGLERLSLDFLESSLTPDSACDVLEQAHGFDETDLTATTLVMMAENGEEVLESPGLDDLCQCCFHSVVSALCRLVKPESMFNAAVRWSGAECVRQGLDVTPQNQRKVIGSGFFHILFPDMDPLFFVKTVVPSKLLTNEEHVKILSYFLCPVEDVSPFGSRYTREDRALLERVTYFETFVVPVCCDQKKFGESPKGEITDDLFVRCSQKVMFHGFNIFGSGRQHIFCHNYHIKVYKNVSCHGNYRRLTLETDILASSLSDANGIASANLGRPVFLDGGETYHILVTLKSGDLPLHTGEGQRLSVEVGQVKFYFGKRTSPARLISGIIFSDGSPKDGGLKLTRNVRLKGK